jgi:hypothetical protein
MTRGWSGSRGRGPTACASCQPSLAEELSNVRPRLPVHNVPHGALAHAEPFRERHGRFARGVSRSRLSHGLRGHPRAPVLESTQRDNSNCSPFGDHVGDVVSLCADEAVLGANASRRVAVVAQVAARPFPVTENPSNAVSEPAPAAIPEDAIAMLVGRPLPQPAGIGLVDFRPKPRRHVAHGAEWSLP